MIVVGMTGATIGKAMLLFHRTVKFLVVYLDQLQGREMKCANGFPKQLVVTCQGGVQGLSPQPRCTVKCVSSNGKYSMNSSKVDQHNDYMPSLRLIHDLKNLST